MQINGQHLTPEIFVELIGSKAWTIQANEHVYSAFRQEGEERLTIWAYFSEIYNYLETYWPRRINTVQYQALNYKNWAYQLDSTSKYMEVRRIGHEAVVFWLPLQELTSWGQAVSTIGETFTITAAIKNRSTIQTPEQYNVFRWARAYSIDTTPSQDTKEWKESSRKRPAQRRHKTELQGINQQKITIEWDSDSDSDGESVNSTVSNSSTATTWVSQRSDRSSNQGQEEEEGFTPHREPYKEEEGIRRFNEICHSLRHEEREEIKRWQEETKPEIGFQALGSYIYVDDEEGWVFRTIEQQLKKPTITEDEVTWPHSGTKKEEVEKYAQRYKIDQEYQARQRQEEADFRYLSRHWNEAQRFEEESRRRRGPSRWECGEPDYYPQPLNYSASIKPTWAEGYPRETQRRRVTEKLATKPWW